MASGKVSVLMTLQIQRKVTLLMQLLNFSCFRCFVLAFDVSTSNGSCGVQWNRQYAQTHHFPELIQKHKQDKGFASGKYAFSKVSNSRNKSYLNRAKNVEGSVTTHFPLFLFSCPAAAVGVGQWCSQLLLLGDLQLQFFWDRVINLIFFKK